MNGKIWRVLAQILYNRNDLADIIKPFFEHLKNESINDERYIPLLKTFSEFQLEILYKNGIIPRNKINSLKYKNKKFNADNSNHNKNFIEEIISGDKVNDLQELMQEKNSQTINIVTNSFREIHFMKIPLIQYCIIKKAIKCFKYLLVNGYDDPRKTMEEQNPEHFYDSKTLNTKTIKRYEWNCMATAIYFGNKEIIKILEDKGIKEEKNLSCVEAAILSYRNEIVEQIIDEIKEKATIKKLLKIAIFTSCISNNIKGTELLIRREVNINELDEKLNLFTKIVHPFIMQQGIIQRKLELY